MRLLDLICEQLGVEVGEEWEDFQTGEEYRISLIGLEKFRKCDETWNLATAFDHGKLMRGKLKPIWKPKKGGLYYIPAIYDIGDIWQEMVWLDDAHDIEYYGRGLVFKTKEEAVDAANKMLNALKGD